MVQVEYRFKDYVGLHLVNNCAADTKFITHKLALDHALGNLWPVSGVMFRRFESFQAHSY